MKTDLNDPSMTARLEDIRKTKKVSLTCGGLVGLVVLLALANRWWLSAILLFAFVCGFLEMYIHVKKAEKDLNLKRGYDNEKDPKLSRMALS